MIPALAYHFPTGIVVLRAVTICADLRAVDASHLSPDPSPNASFETAPMKIHATLPAKGRDLRLDLFRGIANWAIFLDHIPDNVVNWITTRNYGFSDAADLFVFISGYTASFVYARMMIERGFLVGATRLFKRVWQLYVAHIVLFVIYIVAIGYLAQRFGDSDIINEFNVAGLVDHATETLGQGLILKFKPVNLDVLPLYIVLMGFFPPVLWLMLRQPDLTMLASIVLWLAGPAVRLEFCRLSRPAPGISTPTAWQVLFMFGSWCALGGAREVDGDHRCARSRCISASPICCSRWS